jgi:hypothetical protein
MGGATLQKKDAGLYNTRPQKSTRRVGRAAPADAARPGQPPRASSRCTFLRAAIVESRRVTLERTNQPAYAPTRRRQASAAAARKTNPEWSITASNDRAAETENRRHPMTRYETAPPRSRAVFGLAAFAMTALTIGLAVVAPAHFGSGAADTRTLAGARPADPDRIEVAISPARIDVVAARARKSAFDTVRPTRRQEG